MKIDTDKIEEYIGKFFEVILIGIITFMLMGIALAAGIVMWVYPIIPAFVFILFALGLTVKFIHGRYVKSV